jgi:group II intron reverse transcriptase/maturase
MEPTDHCQPDTTKLFDDLCSIARLRNAFVQVRRNRGAPGIDGVEVDEFAANLDEELGRLATELRTWTYRPMPVRGVEIPKPQGGTRILGVPCIRDRVVQGTIKELLEPILDPKFSMHSYGFRPGRNQQLAVEAAEALVRSGKRIVVDIDLSKFFDRIHHDRLIARVGRAISDKRMLRLIGMTLRSGIMRNGLVHATTEGATQGSPLSPLLSNVVLDELDKELERRGLSFCRYADDCNIFVRSAKAAHRAMENISVFIETRLKLVVNRDKSQVAPVQRVSFLGMTITAKGGRAISRKSMQRALTRVKELTPRGTHLTLEKSIEQINKWYQGWSSYYAMTRFPYQLSTIESRIRRRLRARIVVQQRRPCNLKGLLIKRGVSPKTAGRMVYSHVGPWALSHKTLDYAFPNEWFASKGFRTLSDQQREHWCHIRRAPRL